MSNIVLINTFAVVVGSIVLTRIIHSWLMPKPIPNVPHNPITSIWGDLPAITKNTKERKREFMDYTDVMVKKYGRIFQLLFGNHPVVVISDLRETERLLVESKVTEQAKRVRYSFMAASPNSQIALPTDEAWKRHRRLSGPSMSRRYLERMSIRISTGANNLVKLWAAKIDIVGPRPFDAGLDTQLSTLDIMGDITMGYSLGCIEAARAALPTSNPQTSPNVQLPHPNPPPLYQAVGAMMENIQAALQAPFPLLHARLTKHTSLSWRRQFNILSSFLSDAITEARKREHIITKEEIGLATDADCVLDMIVQRETREGAEAFEEGAIHDELMSFVFAGQDTASSTIRWLLKYLPTDTEIQYRLHDEICGVFGQGEDFDELLEFNLLDDPERLPMLEAVAAETMRCACVGPQISRELIQDEVILGRHIPKGTDLVFSLGLISNDKAEWGHDADEWRPTRWLTPDGKFDRSAGPSFPFGLGLRSCFGQRLGQLEIKIYIAALSRAFFFKPVPKDIDSWDVKLECLTRQPKMCYVLLERWDRK